MGIIGKLIGGILGGIFALFIINPIFLKIINLLTNQLPLSLIFVSSVAVLSSWIILFLMIFLGWKYGGIIPI